MRWLALLLLTLAAPAAAQEEVVLGLSSDRVAITATFDGDDILVFGAVKREQAIPEEPLHVIVAVAGPAKPLTVRRKEKRYGIWINTDSVEIDSAPSFYKVATSGAWGQVISDVEDLRHRISIPRRIRSVGAPMNVEDAAAFTEAVIRIRRANGLYRMLEDAVALDEQTLFRTRIELPANLTEGNYSTRIFLTRQGRVVNQFETTIYVQKVGLEKFLFSLSREQPLVYGLLSLAIAIAAGWGASAAFRVLRPGV